MAAEAVIKIVSDRTPRIDIPPLHKSANTYKPLSVRYAVSYKRIFAKHKPERTPGLHAGAYQVSDDFDDPLPEDFLITNK